MKMGSDDRVKVLTIVESYGKDLYGVSTELTQVFNSIGGAVNWHVGSGVVGEIPLDTQPFISKLPFGTRMTNYWSPGQSNEIFALMDRFEPDIVHVHGVFTALQRSTIHCARRFGSPILLSSHGMLEPWLWQQKGNLYRQAKEAFWRFIIEPVVSRANFLHAITVHESTTLRNFFPNIPQILIPNAIDLASGEFYQAKNVPPERYILFLSRIHPVKGIETLISAFARSKAKRDFKLMIVGPVWDSRYSLGLQEQVKNLGLREKIVFFGPIFGERKIMLINRAWALVLPSYSEVVGLVNLEAAACFTPSITTYNTGLLDWEDGGGLLVNPDVQELTAALDRVACWTLDDRLDRGRRSRTLVEQRYSMPVAKKRWVEAYEYIRAESGSEST